MARLFNRYSVCLGAAALVACAVEPPPPVPEVPAAEARQATGQVPEVETTRAAQAVRVDDAARRCPALAQQAGAGVNITQAELVTGGSVKPVNWLSRQSEGEPLPEHCRLRGMLDERTGKDHKPYHIGFELRLPSAWNGRFFYQGGGGNDGIVFDAIGRNTGADGFRDNALARGFAVVATDAGHQGSGPSFGLDPQARIDHAYRAHERSAVTAKVLVAAYYGKPADRSYFVGCSGGGRQGMMFSQRFPATFDGIVAVAPAMRVAEGASIAAAWTVQRFMSVAPRGRGGKPVLSQAFSNDDLFVVAQGILKSCDAADGARDGFVQDMAACRFDPAEVQCKRGKNGDCLRANKVKVLREVMAGPHTKAGRPLYTAWPWDPGIAAPGWRAWTLGHAPAGVANDARHITLMSGAIGHEFVTPPDPKLGVLNFDFERDPKRMRAFQREYGTADDVQLAGFRQHDGKLLLMHGAADPIFSTLETLDYQQRLNTAHGADKAAGFARSFIVPGMNHCAGGPATDRFDALSAIVDWVEKGQAPQRIEARGSAVLDDVTRPLCPWPKVARYKGAGPLNISASFECR